MLLETVCVDWTLPLIVAHIIAARRGLVEMHLGQYGPGFVHISRTLPKAVHVRHSYVHPQELSWIPNKPLDSIILLSARMFLRTFEGGLRLPKSIGTGSGSSECPMSSVATCRNI